MLTTKQHLILVWQRFQRGSEGPCAITIFLSDDVMLAHDRLSVRTDRGQFQRVIQDPGFLGELETCKPGMVRVTETRGQNQTQRLTQELVITPAIHLAKPLIDLANHTRCISTDKGKILLFTQLTNRILGP